MKETKIKVTCRDCGQGGYVLEIEKFIVQEQAAPGECADDMRTFFYEIKVIEGRFEIIHRDPNSPEYTVICQKCNSKNISLEKV